MGTRSSRNTSNAAHPSRMAAVPAMLLVLPLSLPAQGVVEPDVAGAETGVNELETVTVTARRGEERAKDIPFSISVVEGEEIEAQRLLDVEEVLRATPGVEVNSSGDPQFANVRIRGVGSLFQTTEDDASVVLNVDGVSMSARRLGLATLDVERVEVLKGPQGTLYGANSEAGAINITTRRPTPYLEGHFRGEYGEEGQHLLEAVVSGPLSRSVSGRLAIRNTGAEHWVDNRNTGDPLSDPKGLTFRGSLLWDGGPTSVLLIGERDHSTENVSLFVLRPYGDDPAQDYTPGVFDDNENTLERYSLQIDHDLSFARITSVTAATHSDFVGVKGYDGDLMEALFGFRSEYLREDASDERVLSQELRLTSLPGARTFWVAGLYLSDKDRAFDTRDFVTGNSEDRDMTIENYAAFGEVTYPLTDALDLTAGARYTIDRRTYEADYFTAFGVVPDARDIDDDYATGRLALSYALTPETNVYGIYSRGYKPAGFNDFAIQPADTAPYEPARVNAFEIGFKSESADGRLRLNGALFYNQVTDDHLLGFDNRTFATRIINVDTESVGAELEGTWILDNGLALSGGLSYIDATITSDALGVYGGDVESGNRVPDVPRFGGNLSLSYTRSLPGFFGLDAPALDARIDYRYVGERPANAQNSFDLDAYNKVDLRLGLRNGPFEIYAWADNLLDEQYDLYGFYETFTFTGQPVEYGAPARGRTLGLGLSYLF
jgi:iron complex outermembrane recepter protein